MRISSVELTPFVENSRLGQLLVLRNDSNKLAGVGEIVLADGRAPTESTIPFLADLLVGRNPFDVEALLIDAAGFTEGASDDAALIAAATSAMLDLAGMSLNTSTDQLLGGRVRDSARACAIGWAEEVVGEPELIAAAQRTVAAGFTLLRVEPFLGSSPNDSPDLFAATEVARVVRDAVPDEIDIVIAADGRLSSADAAQFAHALQPIEPLWLEEPVQAPLPSLLKRVSERVNLALAAGRTSRPDVLRDLVARNIVDHLVVDVSRVGGLIEARRIAALAEIYHIGIVPAGSGGSVALRAALHLAAVVPNLSVVEVRPGLTVVQGGMVALDDLRLRRSDIPSASAEVVS